MYDRFVLGGRLFAVVIATAALTACGGGSGSDSAASGSEGPPSASTPGNAAPVISGKAVTTATAGMAYSFTPTASDADKDTLTFSIDSKPSWASFDSKTGRISGTPTSADVGSHENIVVKVSDGKATSALPEFAVNVAATGGGSSSGSATLSWQAPAENVDGTALTNLTGYKIHYGTKPGTYTKTIDVNTVGVTTYVVDNLEAGTYYFAITAVTKTGESDLSGEASTTIG
jgi:Putative Ig domain